MVFWGCSLDESPRPPGRSRYAWANWGARPVFQIFSWEKLKKTLQRWTDKWRFPKMCIPKSFQWKNPSTDDDWGYPHDSGNKSERINWVNPKPNLSGKLRRPVVFASFSSPAERVIWGRRLGAFPSHIGHPGTKEALYGGFHTLGYPKSWMVYSGKSCIWCFIVENPVIYRFYHGKSH